MVKKLRVAPLLVPMAAAMLVALWAGLVRIGWPLPATPRIIVAHGPLMVIGVMGTVISLERAVAVGRLWAFAAPAFSLAAAITQNGWLAAAGASVYFAALVFLATRARDLSALVIVAGAVVYVIGSVLWALGNPIFSVLPWWSAWLVLTVAGERLELTRVMPPSKTARVLLVGIALAICASAALPARVRGVATIAMALWLLRFDVARRVISRPGAPRFTAIALLSGYAWLGVSGAVLVRFGELVAGPMYDAATHALFLGFVFSMVFGHAPTILPAVVGAPLPFHRAFYVHVALLHAGLVLRIAGDLAGSPTMRAWGGLTNAAALLAFIAITASRSLYVQRQNRLLRAVDRHA